MATSKPMLGDLELQQVQKIEVDEDQALAQQSVPALEGDFLQRLGRRATQVGLTGVLTGDEAEAGLKTLQEKFRAAEPVSFVADIATATKVDQVLIEELGMRELAGRPQRFEYALTLREYAPPPKPEPPPPAPPPPAPPSLNTGTLVVDVTVTGQPGFDFSTITVSVAGIQDDGTQLNRTITQRSENTWTDDQVPPGQYTVTVMESDAQSLSGSASATIQVGQTAQVSITLTPATNIAQTFIVHYRFDKAFIEPAMRQVLKQVADYARAHTDEKLLIVGHTDLTRNPSIPNYNQSLSERRARGVYACLTFGGDIELSAAALDEWNALRAKRPANEDPSIKDSWGVHEYQHILQDLGFYPGNVDGIDGTLTQNAVSAYRCKKGLPPGTTVDDQTWEALIEDYLSQEPLSIPESQFLPNCGNEILKWLGCGEKDPVKNISSAWRPNRRTELLFVQADRLPCEVPQPVTFDLPTKGTVNSNWCVGGNATQLTCFVTPAKDACSSGSATSWCRQPAEPGTLTVQGSIKREQADGRFVPVANQKFVLIAPDGQFKAGELSSGEPQAARTGKDGSFTFSNLRVGIYSLEVIAPVLVRLAEDSDASSKGNAVVKHLSSDTDRLDVVVVNAPNLREITLPVAVHLMTALHPLTREVRTCPASGGGAPLLQATAHTDDEIRTAFATANDIWQQARIQFKLTDIVRETYAFRTDCEIDENEFQFLLERCAYPGVVNVLFVGELKSAKEPGLAGLTLSPEHGAAFNIMGGCSVGDRSHVIFAGQLLLDILDAQKTAQTLAHELGHYLNLPDLDPTPTNTNRLMLNGTIAGSNRTLVPDEVNAARASKGASDNCVSLTLKVTGATQVGGTLSNQYIVLQNAASTVTVDATIPNSLIDPSRGTLTMTGGNAGATNLQRTVSVASKGVVQVVATYTPAGGGDIVTAQVEIRVATFALSVDGATQAGGPNSTTFVTTSDAKQVVTVKAVIDPELFSVPSNLVTWSGGTAVADPLRRTVSRASVASTAVSATLAGSTQSVTIIVTVPKVEIILLTQDAAAGASTPLADAWVYWNEAGHLDLLRTDKTGRVFDLRTGADKTHPWEYIKHFTTTPGTQVELYYSLGATSLPDDLLNENPGLFTQVTIPAPSIAAGPPAQHALLAFADAGVPTSSATVPGRSVQLTKPRELSFWPLLWTTPGDTYYTDGLPQGAALWTHSGALTVLENDAAPQPSAAVRPKERGLKIEGTMDAQATGVKIRILDSNLHTVELHQGTPTSPGVQEITGTVGAATGTTKSFESVVFFTDAASVFGPVAIVIEPTGLPKPIIENFLVYLCGLQIALVDDNRTNGNGQERGPILNEANETIIVDFRDSPQSTRAALQAQTRARRMVSYQFSNNSRLFDPNQPPGVNNPSVLKPQMPMWMAEFQMIGINVLELWFLLAIRHFIQLIGRPLHVPLDLLLELQWDINLSWHGPDSHQTGVYHYAQDFVDRQTIAIKLDPHNFLNIEGLDAHGQVANAFNPPPVALTFPVEDRRLPQVIISGQKRSWGRQSPGVDRDTILIEWQPHIVDGTGREIMRGGDGKLTLKSATIDGQPIDPGLIPSGTGTVQPPTGDPLITLPTLRVCGLNPIPSTDVQTLINTAVAFYFNAHNAQASVSLLSLNCWQTTARLIFQAEGHSSQFDTRGIGTRLQGFRGLFYGHELDMPLFGPPHGYGFGQFDPPMNDDVVWSFFENIKRAAEFIMHDKAGPAFNRISSHLPHPLNQTIRAVYQREIVREYNGFTEFIWNGTQWEISPSLSQWADPGDHSRGANPNLNYPNMVLGTHVVYFTGHGAATIFPWPIVFTEFGPGTGP